MHDIADRIDAIEKPHQSGSNNKTVQLDLIKIILV